MSKPKRDFSSLEARRHQAAELFAAEVSQAEVSRRLKVSRQSVSRWYKSWERAGIKGMAGAGRAGRMPKVSESALGLIKEALKNGPRANGIAADLWTLARVRKLIKQLTGISYGVSGVWYVMKRLNWSVQRPGRRALQRDEQAIERWRKQTWTAVKKTPDASDD